MQDRLELFRIRCAWLLRGAGRADRGTRTQSWLEGHTEIAATAVRWQGNIAVGDRDEEMRSPPQAADGTVSPKML